MIREINKRVDIVGKIALFFYVVFGVGMIGIVLHATRAAMLSLVAYVLLSCAVLLFFSIYRGLKRTDVPGFIGWYSFVFVATVFLEGLGVNYGLVFGAYRYSDTLGIKVWGVPLLIGLNWITVILGSVALVRTITNKTCFLALGVGACALLFDYLLEPVAMYLDFWQWDGPIPLRNYVAWFMIAAVGAVAFKHTQLSFDGRLARSLFAAQTFFFVGIRLLMWLT